MTEFKFDENAFQMRMNNLLSKFNEWTIQRKPNLSIGSCYFKDISSFEVQQLMKVLEMSYSKHNFNYEMYNNGYYIVMKLKEEIVKRNRIQKNIQRKQNRLIKLTKIEFEKEKLIKEIDDLRSKLKLELIYAKIVPISLPLE